MKLKLTLFSCLTHLQFFSMHGVVIDTEGQASEPLGCSDDPIGGGDPPRYQGSRCGKGLEFLPEIVEEVAALKLLQPTPLYPRSMGESFGGITSILVRDQGRFLKRLHRPSRFRVCLHELEEESGSQYPYGFAPAYLNTGLMKPQRGLTLVTGEEKLRGQDPLAP